LIELLVRKDEWYIIKEQGLIVVKFLNDVFIELFYEGIEIDEDMFIEVEEGDEYGDWIFFILHEAVEFDREEFIIEVSTFDVNVFLFDKG
jgi:hypothetical protein